MQIRLLCLALTVLIGACATTEGPIETHEVKTVVPVACIEKLPAKPVLSAAATWAKPESNEWQRLQALRADYKRLTAYAAQLEAAFEPCSKTN